jgi:hypothetical protein
MPLMECSEYLRTEHNEMLHLADEMEAGLKLAGNTAFGDRTQGLARLRALEFDFRGAVEHCRSEDLIIGSAFRRYLTEEELANLEEEHGRMLRILGDFLEELRFATIDRMSGMMPAAREVIEQLRTHVRLEAGIVGGALQRPAVTKSSEVTPRSTVTAGKRSAGTSKEDHPAVEVDEPQAFDRNLDLV